MVASHDSLGSRNLSMRVSIFKVLCFLCKVRCSKITYTHRNRGFFKGGKRKGGFHTAVRGTMFLRDGAVTPRPSHEYDINFFAQGRPKSAQQLRDSTVAARRAQTVTEPSSRVTRECRSPGLRSPPLKECPKKMFESYSRICTHKTSSHKESSGNLWCNGHHTRDWGVKNCATQPLPITPNHFLIARPNLQRRNSWELIVYSSTTAIPRSLAPRLCKGFFLKIT